MTDAPASLDATTYDVVRRRLEGQAGELAAAAGRLAARRQELFGGTKLELVATYRVRTEHACQPRDLVFIDGRFVMGFEVVLGLQARISPAEVLIELEEQGDGLVPVAPRITAQPEFVKDFAEVFQYYKEARLLHLRATATRLLAAFQTGSRLTDLRVLRWDRRADGSVAYLDNRGIGDYQFPVSHDFTWTRTTREMHVQGAHPHINILDTIFVECVHGDLTVKIENNTASGQGVYAETVDDPTQGLDDAEIYFVGLESAILLKMRPYREKDFRYLVYSRTTRQVVRIDALGQACQQLPEGHGLVYPGGYYLSDGSHKTFPVDASGMEFKRVLRGPSGEHVAYIFYRRDLGTYLILIYDVIARSMQTPMHVHSYCRVPDGRLVTLRAEPEPGRIHTLQVWRSPFCDEDRLPPPAADSALARIGNREVVRAVSDLGQLGRIVANPSPNRDLYDDLVKRAQRTLDSYPWLGEPETGGCRERLTALRTTAEQVVDEFVKVEALARQAGERLARQGAAVDAALRELTFAKKDTVDAFTVPLANLRSLRGQVDQLKSVRFIEVPACTALDARIAKAAAELSQQAVGFLLAESALAPQTAEVAELEANGAVIATVVEAKPIAERLAAIAAGGDLLVETVNGLAIEDANQRTAILGRIAEVLATANRARAVLDRRRKELAGVEGRAAWTVQAQLLAQAATAALALCTTPEACDEQNARLSVQIEDLEGRFADVDEIVAELAEQRVRIAESVASRRSQLADGRARSADRLATAAERLLTTIARRAKAAASLDELSAYLAADPLVRKYRDQVGQLRTLGAAVRADDLDGRLKAAREDAARSIRDRSDLSAGEGLVRLGRHAFTVNRQAPELALIPRRDDEGVHLEFQLAGTDLAWPCTDAGTAARAEVFEQLLESEDSLTCRAEWLAWTALTRQAPGAGILDESSALALVQTIAADSPDGGYERGIHDADAARILVALDHLGRSAGLLRYGPACRAAAILGWAGCADAARRERLATEAASLDRLRQAGLVVPAWAVLAADCQRLLGAATQADSGATAEAGAGAYLAEELARDGGRSFVLSGEAASLGERLAEWIRLHPADRTLDEALRALAADPAAALRLATAWIGAVAPAELTPAVPEAAAALLASGLARVQVSARTVLTIEGLLSNHPRIRDGRLEVRLDESLARLAAHGRNRLPLFRAWRAKRTALIAAERRRLRLDEMQPKVLTSFVRNRLVNEVYLPLVGDNLAKQLGAAGAQRRTDSQGLLLLISPPGYGKTTLLEYVAAVLGLAWVKVNGPALGHRTVSLDPAEAPNLSARNEVERINLAFAMGSNVLLLIDDIQHCSPEFLQKFIPLGDGTRRIEGVWHGEARTFDLRGKRFVIAMAGNPYTESGDRFRIPDMLANRADTWNLGEVAGGAGEAFALSYLENCLVANPVLHPLAARPGQDLFRLLRISQGDDGARSELEHPYSGAEVAEVTTVLGHLRRARDLLLRVNQTYISSAAQGDADRTEPPFKLQGSYRNMAKIAARVVPALTPGELTQVLLDHYQAEAQTLTSAAEANVLKLKHLAGVANPTEQARWTDLCRGFARRTELSGSDDPQEKAVIMLAKLGERLEGLQIALVHALTGADASRRSELAELLAQLGQGLAALKPPAPVLLPPPLPVEPPRVEVINTLPAAYGRLFEKQALVIEAVLIPLIERLGQYIGTSQQTRGQLETVAGDLRTWISKTKDSPRIRVEDNG